MATAAKRPPSASAEFEASNERNCNGFLCSIAQEIRTEVEREVPHETVQFCGSAPLDILHSKPAAVLDLAREKLHSWPYHNVPTHWRRLYEDASLLVAAEVLEDQAKMAFSAQVQLKRARTDCTVADDEWFARVVAILDKASIIVGAPGREAFIEHIIHQLDSRLRPSRRYAGPKLLNVPNPPQLRIEHPVLRAESAVNLAEFQMHLDASGLPIVIPKSFEHWSAIQHWADLQYLMRSTLNGHRLIPVEVGSSYTDADWTQRIMTFREFADKYLLPEEPTDTGYIAQHDLFAQMPGLKNDFTIPDYCFTAPRPATGPAALTPGLSSAPQLDEPLMNAWLGPKGTTTPLHTDPYHNILCQVVGYKYIRLFAPDETHRLYPHSTDDSGVSMANTSRVDVEHFRSKMHRTDAPDQDAREGLSGSFPLFKDAQYQEAVLAPGECLYIPLGWWHYVESLTTSFSVSFWWN